MVVSEQNTVFGSSYYAGFEVHFSEMGHHTFGLVNDKITFLANYALKSWQLFALSPKNPPLGRPKKGTFVQISY